MAHRRRLQPLIRHDGITDRRRWESALFLKVRAEIQTGNLAIDGAKNFGRFEAFFLPSAQWEQVREALWARTGVPVDPDAAVEQLKARLSDAFDRFLEGVASGLELARNLGRTEASARAVPAGGSARGCGPAGRAGRRGRPIAPTPLTPLRVRPNARTRRIPAAVQVDASAAAEQRYPEAERERRHKPRRRRCLPRRARADSDNSDLAWRGIVTPPAEPAVTSRSYAWSD